MHSYQNHFTLHRTLRVPDSEGKAYKLPPSLGGFELIPCKGTAAPLAWENDYMFPMYASEAMWISFNRQSPPKAIVVTASAVNVVTGEVIQDIDKITLSSDPQNYMVTRTQPWIDGIKHTDGKVRQFVSVPFTTGKSLGEQVAGIKDDTIKLVFYPTKFPEKYERSKGLMRGIPISAGFEDGYAAGVEISAQSMSMGIGAGGEIEQKIYPDPYGISEWNLENPIKFNIRVVNALMWEALTGNKPHHQAPDRNDYKHYSYPWFDLYDEKYSDTKPTDVLAAIKSAYDGSEAPINYAPPIAINKVMPG